MEISCLLPIFVFASSPLKIFVLLYKISCVAFIVVFILRSSRSSCLINQSSTWQRKKNWEFNSGLKRDFERDSWRENKVTHVAIFSVRFSKKAKVSLVLPPLFSFNCGLLLLFFLPPLEIYCWVCSIENENFLDCRQENCWLFSLFFRKIKLSLPWTLRPRVDCYLVT